MIVADILHSLSDKAVAEAAVISIGGDFAATMKSQAAHRGVTVGGLTVSLVSGFAVAASERDWRVLMAKMAGQDHPVLAGLRVIAEQMLHRQGIDGPRARSAVPAPAYTPASSSNAALALS